MGIRGLASWIAWSAGTTIEEPQWETWRGKRLGVDILCLLYNSKSRKQCPFLYLGKLIVAAKQCGITLFPIFDGKPPQEKLETIKQRGKVRDQSNSKRLILEYDISHTIMSESQKEVVHAEIRKLEKKGLYFSSEEREMAKQIFYACGVVSLNATGEADNVLSYFTKRGEFDGVISNDYDLLARGVETLLVPEQYALPGDPSGWKQYTLSKILQTVQVQYDQFLEICVLMGSDYTTGKKTLPYKLAFWAIKYGGSFERALENLHIKESDRPLYYKAKEILRGSEENRESLMGEKQWEKWAQGDICPEINNIQELRRSYFQGLTDQEYAMLTTTNLNATNLNATNLNTIHLNAKFTQHVELSS